MRKYLLIDGSNLVHAAQGAKKLTVGTTQVQAIYGVVRTMRALVSTYASFTPIVLWDGASWRKVKFATYKEGREKNHTAAYEKQQEEKEHAKKQIPAVQKALTLLGIDQVKAFNMEADDLAAIMGDRYVDRGDQVILVSGDKDWVQLVKPRMMWFDPINDRKIKTAADIETALGYKVDSFEQFLAMKCLCGDAGDSVPGVGGIGEKGAIEFLQTYGSVANFNNMCLDGTVDPTTVPKKFRALYEDEDKRIAYDRNLMLMDLRTKERPDPVNLKVTRGEPDKDRFEQFCEKLLFMSILRQLDAWIQPFPAFRQSLENAA